jgi:hypothetical protein
MFWRGRQNQHARRVRSPTASSLAGYFSEVPAEQLVRLIGQRAELTAQRPAEAE